MSRLAQRFRATFTSILAITACIGATAYFGSMRLTSVAQSMYANDVLVLSNLGKAVVHMKHMRLLQYRLLHTTSRQLRDIQLRDIDSAQTQSDLLMERCAALARRDNPEEQQRIAHLRQLWS